MGGTQTLKKDGSADRVGRYRLVRSLGSTPYGMEHLATSRTAGGLQAACRLLIVDRDLVRDPKEALRDLRPLIALSHGRLLRLLDAGVAGKDLYVAYEYQVGRDLADIVIAQRVKRGSLPLPLALHICGEVLAALTHAESHGRSHVSRAHGGIRPEAVLVTADGRIRLTHFGLASVLGSTSKGDDDRPPRARDAAAAADLLLGLLTDKAPTASTRGGAAGSVMREVGARLAEAIGAAEGPNGLTPAALQTAVDDLQSELSIPLPADALSSLLEDLFGEELVREGDELSRLLEIDSMQGVELPETPPPAPAPAEEDESWTPKAGGVIAGRYRIARSLGEGGMGEVVEAEHLALGRRVAVKILHPALSHDPEFAERFRREARAACRIGHQHIVDVMDFGTTPDGCLFYVMELLGGRSLGALLDELRVLPQLRAVRIMLQVCDALDAAHEAQVVHRDLKPDNLMVTDEGEAEDFVRVVDFGIAQDDDPTSKRVTHTGQIVGTPPYMAPEQVRGTPTDARTDIYSAGAILYEMVTGSAPFTADTAVEVMSLHLKDPPVPPRERAPRRDIHPMVEAAILKALEKEPEDRYQSMADFAFDLWAAVEAIKTEGPRGLPGAAVPSSRDSTVPELEVDGSEASEDLHDPAELGSAPTSPALPANVAALDEGETARSQWWNHLPWWAPMVAVAAVVVAVGAAYMPALLGPSQRTIANESSGRLQRQDASLGLGPGDDLELLRSEKRPRRRRRHRESHQPVKVEAPPEKAPTKPPADNEVAERHAEARAHLKGRRYVYAAHAYRVLVSRNPNDATAHAGLGQAQLARGRRAEAVDHLQKAVRLRPTHSGYRVMLAGALLQSGRPADARAQCEAVLRRDPDNAHAKRLLRRLR